MVRFWRDWNDATERHRVRELDIKWLVALGRTDDSFSRVDVVSAGARKLATLLPDLALDVNPRGERLDIGRHALEVEVEELQN